MNTKVVKILILMPLLAIFFFGCNNFRTAKVGKGYSYIAEISTNHGDIAIHLLNETPIHRDNFVAKADSGFYNGLMFHRVVKDFVIQIGDSLTRDRSPEARDKYNKAEETNKIKAEIIDTIYHINGAVGAARDNNPEKASSTTQFYIVNSPLSDRLDNYLSKKLKSGDFTSEQVESYRAAKGGTPHLDGGYTVFGYVVKGMDVVSSICDVEVDKASIPLSHNEPEIESINIKVVKDKKIKKLYSDGE